MNFISTPTPGGLRLASCLWQHLCLTARRMPKCCGRRDAQKQQGSVLIVSMLILLVLTLIGVTAMGTSALEEKMAGNSSDQNQAFQAAESTLRDAEALMTGMVGTGGFNNTNGLYAMGGGPDITLASTWNSTNSRAYSGTLPGITTQPRYIIELGQIVPQASANVALATCYSCQPPPPITFFRITVRATGGSDNAVVMLQSDYARIL